MRMLVPLFICELKRITLHQIYTFNHLNQQFPKSYWDVGDIVSTRGGRDWGWERRPDGSAAIVASGAPLCFFMYLVCWGVKKGWGGLQPSPWVSPRYGKAPFCTQKHTSGFHMISVALLWHPKLGHSLSVGVGITEWGPVLLPTTHKLGSTSLSFRDISVRWNPNSEWLPMNWCLWINFGSIFTQK